MTKISNNTTLMRVLAHTWWGGGGGGRIKYLILKVACKLIMKILFIVLSKFPMMKLTEY